MVGGRGQVYAQFDHRVKHLCDQYPRDCQEDNSELDRRDMEKNAKRDGDDGDGDMHLHIDLRRDRVPQTAESKAKTGDKLCQPSFLRHRWRRTHRDSVFQSISCMMDSCKCAMSWCPVSV